ncbi:MAG: hypothetical protein ACI97B_005061, partial [Verrucomicrobiales bacterium]
TPRNHDADSLNHLQPGHELFEMLHREVHRAFRTPSQRPQVNINVASLSTTLDSVR